MYLMFMGFHSRVDGRSRNNAPRESRVGVLVWHYLHRLWRQRQQSERNYPVTCMRFWWEWGKPILASRLKLNDNIQLGLPYGLKLDETRFCLFAAMNQLTCVHIFITKRLDNSNLVILSFLDALIIYVLRSRSPTSLSSCFTTEFIESLLFTVYCWYQLW